MLDILRRQANSLWVRVTLGAIVVCFVLFFGYSSMDGDVARSGRTVATVNGSQIDENLFRFYDAQVLDQLAGSSPNQETPPFLRQMAQSMAMRQLIGRTLLVEQAQKLGMTIPDEELAAKIIELNSRGPDGFDPISYRNQFLPSFYNRFDLDYEDLVRTDLLTQRFAALFSGMVLPSTPSASTSSQKDAIWQFEMVSIAPHTLQQKGIASNGVEAKRIAEEFAAHPTHWKHLAEKYQVAIEPLGPVSIAQRDILSKRGLSFEAQLRLLALTPQHPTVVETIPAQPNSSDTVLAVRLVNRETVAKSSPPSPLAFFDAWMQQTQAKADIHINKSVIPGQP